MCSRLQYRNQSNKNLQFQNFPIFRSSINSISVTGEEKRSKLAGKRNRPKSQNLNTTTKQPSTTTSTTTTASNPLSTPEPPTTPDPGTGKIRDKLIRY